MAIYRSRHKGAKIDEAVDRALPSGSIDLALQNINQSLQNKQNTLSFDGTPIKDSSNPVTSGGVFNSIKAVEEKISGGTSTSVVEGITVLSSGWVDETETTALWRCRIENAAIEENTIVNVHFLVTDYTNDVPSSLVRATNAGLLAVTTSGAGYVDIYSVNQPDSDLACSLELTGFKVVG